MKADLSCRAGAAPPVNITNWKSLLDENGRPCTADRGGANLFITQEARLKLEEKGVVLFKDSSTNKGGVISSLEVLAGLASPMSSTTRTWW
jgi:glutamate dehydrogenase